MAIIPDALLGHAVILPKVPLVNLVPPPLPIAGEWLSVAEQRVGACMSVRAAPTAQLPARSQFQD